MKKQYSTPTLTTHGNVEEITQLFGSSKSTDFLFFNGANVTSANSVAGEGSMDGIIIPKP
ncbi:lasso peptide [Halotia wernerae UHCC 0503]|nr:lasso peptide [Halotia wernerae UHCC 0503]